jgi:lipopolysaccharide/colanic/teichoic acid biosynthesis glycosyltransferase
VERVQAGRGEAGCRLPLVWSKLAHWSQVTGVCDVAEQAEGEADVPLTVTANGEARAPRPVLLPSLPVTPLLLAGMVLSGALLVLHVPFGQPLSPWPLGLVLGLLCLLLGAAAASTVRATDRPARSERVLRGMLGATIPVLILVLPETTTMTASGVALVAASAIFIPKGMVVGRRAGKRGTSSPGTEDVAMGEQPDAGRGVAPEPLPLLCRLFKRSVDVVVASVALVLIIPVLALAAVAIAAEGRGGILFRQIRVGLDGRPFRMYKLRTMRPANDDGEHRAYVADLIRGDGRPQGGIYKLVADDRRTRVGRLLRTLSIDELPQLWNVLRGDMSVVGPRPPLPAEVALYDEATWARLGTKPGLTGLWQVSGRSRLSFQEMVELDVRYRQEWSPLLDLRILLRTPKAVLWGRETA